jgi:hypothetical protein
LDFLGHHHIEMKYLAQMQQRFIANIGPHRLEFDSTSGSI